MVLTKMSFIKVTQQINIDKVDIRRIVVSSKDSYGKKGAFKYFIGYLNDTVVFPSPLCKKLPQINKHYVLQQQVYEFFSP